MHGIVCYCTGSPYTKFFGMTLLAKTTLIGKIISCYWPTVQWLFERDQAQRNSPLLKETYGFRFLFKNCIPYLLRILFKSDFDGLLLGYALVQPLKYFSAIQILAFWWSCTQPTYLTSQIFLVVTIISSFIITFYFVLNFALYLGSNGWH